MNENQIEEHIQNFIEVEGFPTDTQINNLADKWESYIRQTEKLNVSRILSCRKDFIGGLVFMAKKWKKQVEEDQWIETSKELPPAGTEVMIVIDVRKWDLKRKRRIEKANVHFSKEQIQIGGPNALTGIHKITGTYFSIPAILHPECVTHWKPVSKLPE